MSNFHPETYAEALEIAKSRPKRPRKPLRAVRPISSGSNLLERKRAQVARGTAKDKKPKKKKLLSISRFKKKVWVQFSIFIRTRGADSEGYVQCVTCPARHLWNSGRIHAGHWIHGRLDFDPRNVSPQCATCNYHWNTKVSVAYSIFMVRTYGLEVMEELELLANTQGNRYSREELQTLLEYYRGINSENSLVKSK